jgi:hypothetical protein
VLFGVAVVLFPDGRLPTRFWRVTLRIYCAIVAVLIVATCAIIVSALAAHPIRVDSTAGLTVVNHPTGWFAAAESTTGLAIAALTLAFIARQALSWRRAAGDRRQQLKWLASGATISIVSLVLATALCTPGAAHTLTGLVGSVAWFGVAALPVSIGVAILKYRLYEIDRIISRTLAYAIVTGLLVGVYAGPGAAGHRGATGPYPGGGSSRHPGRRGAVQPGTPPGPARRGPPVQAHVSVWLSGPE